jgi:hypothetical protein
MVKTCPACQAENRDDAQFCRLCGTPFPAIPPTPAAPEDAAGNPCSECGFVNRPGVRYCAKCGVNLLGTVVVPRSQRAHAPSPPPSPTYSPPAWSPPGETPPTWAPPPAPAAWSSSASGAPTAWSPAPHTRASATPTWMPPPEPPPTYPSEFDPLQVPDVPLALEGEQAAAPDVATVIRPSAGIGFGEPPAEPAPRRTGLWAAVAVGLVVAAGVAWYFLHTSPPPAEQAAAPVPATQPAPPPNEAAASSPAAPEPTAAPQAATADANAASAVEAAPPAAVEATPPLTAVAPALPGSAAASSPDDERLAAERRARLARERADRDARAKAAAADREQAAARQRAEQDAARRAAEEQQRQHATPAPAYSAAPTPAAAPPRARTVAEICAGRGLIGQSMCESRECGAPEHANEAVCRRVREAEDRRRGN